MNKIVKTISRKVKYYRVTFRQMSDREKSEFAMMLGLVVVLAVWFYGG